MKSYTLRPDTVTLNFNVTLSGTHIFGDTSLGRAKVGRSTYETVAVPCPMHCCGARFAQSDVMDVRR